MALIKDPKSKKIIEEIIEFLKKVEGKIPEGATLGEILPQTLLDAGPENIENMKAVDLGLIASSATGTAGGLGGAGVGSRIKLSATKLAKSRRAIEPKTGQRGKITPPEIEEPLRWGGKELEEFTRINPKTGHPYISDTVLKQIDSAKIEKLAKEFGRPTIHTTDTAHLEKFTAAVRKLAREEIDDSIKIALKKSQEKSLKKKAAEWGSTPEDVRTATEKLMGKDAVVAFARKGVIPRGAKWALGIGTGTAWVGGNSLALWGAVDNVNFQISSSVGKLDQMVKDGEIEPDDALERIDELEANLDTSEGMIRWTSIAAGFPLITGQRKTFLLAVETQRNAMELIKESIKAKKAEEIQKGLEADRIRDEGVIRREEERQQEGLERRAMEEGILSGEGITLEDTRDIRERGAFKGGPGEMIKDPVTGRMMERSEVQRLQDVRAERERIRARDKKTKKNQSRIGGGSNFIRQSGTPFSSREKKIKGVV